MGLCVNVCKCLVRGRERGGALKTHHLPDAMAMNETVTSKFPKFISTLSRAGSLSTVHRQSNQKPPVREKKKITPIALKYQKQFKESEPQLEYSIRSNNNKKIKKLSCHSKRAMTTAGSSSAPQNQQQNSAAALLPPRMVTLTLSLTRTHTRA